ncbi:hypothetical protein [Novosphingobium resinovorum]|uniref:hypothetical protein n=1 Tax=Novosphingobium resinovorum TaxID=158500 RepID=UPI002ED09FE6|nr:hypothetical protein [Novosphingobium resinovorum]
MGLGSLHPIGIVEPELGAALRGHIAPAGGQVLLQPRIALAQAGMRFATPIVTGILGHPIFFAEAAVAGGILAEAIELPEAAG